jgi:hypothetical protein
MMRKEQKEKLMYWLAKKALENNIPSKVLNQFNSAIIKV